MVPVRPIAAAMRRSALTVRVAEDVTRTAVVCTHRDPAAGYAKSLKIRLARTARAAILVARASNRLAGVPVGAHIRIAARRIVPASKARASRERSKRSALPRRARRRALETRPMAGRPRRGRPCRTSCMELRLGMVAEVTIDHAGRLVIPKAFGTDCTSRRVRAFGSAKTMDGSYFRPIDRSRISSSATDFCCSSSPSRDRSRSISLPPERTASASSSSLRFDDEGRLL